VVNYILKHKQLFRFIVIFMTG